ncbi:hypothetical protein KSF78_0009450 [Schistosoma japonicum]|nr:hypothetical protein KSF78_0009450 [Schistosoma japonicum]KAH8857191.1 hypothetical protein KSF78_0009450 [Schistosoma japonicum]
MSSNELQTNWVTTFLRNLSEDIDAEILGEYIFGIINESHGSSESHSEVAELLSAYLPPEKSKSAATEIISEYERTLSGNGIIESSINDIQSVEDQMRSLMQADCMRIVETKKHDFSDRDTYTQSILRSTGTAAYQKDSDGLEDAVADSELITRHRSNSTTTDLLTSSSSNRFVETGGGFSDDESNTDLEDVENLCGYGRKDDIKPGTVEDALSILTSSLTTTSTQCRGSNISDTSQNVKSIKQISSPLSSHLVDNLLSHSHKTSTTRQKQPKKKCPPPSKHIAKIGAQAEAKQKQCVNSKTSLTTIMNNTDPKMSHCKRDDMEAFLFTDSDNNTETIDEASVAIAKQRKENLEQRKEQLEKINQRRQTANRRAQKVERRRL